MFLYPYSEDSDQTGRMPRLIGIFAGRTGHFVGFVLKRLSVIGDLPGAKTSVSSL